MRVNRREKKIMKRCTIFGCLGLILACVSGAAADEAAIRAAVDRKSVV